MRWIVGFFLFLVLNGCAVSTNGAGKTKGVVLNSSAYLGQKLISFILDNGTPYSKKIVSKNRIRYSWNSHRSAPMVASSMGDAMNRDVFECELRIDTTYDGKIVRIIALENSGTWSVSACHYVTK